MIFLIRNLNIRGDNKWKTYMTLVKKLEYLKVK